MSAKAMTTTMTVVVATLFIASPGHAEDNQALDDEMYCRFFPGGWNDLRGSPQDISDVTSVDNSYIGSNPQYPGSDHAYLYYAYSWRDHTGVVLKFSYEGLFVDVEGEFGFEPGLNWWECGS